MKIVEVVGGTTNSTKQFIWCGNERCEARDASSAVTAQYFSYGETISGTPYFFSNDHLGSVREMTNSAGTLVWQQSFDPYGVPTTLVNTTAADFGYTGYYVHQRSGLNLSATRAYSAGLGRFTNRDPVTEAGGINLYAYVSNNPISFTDRNGLQCGDKEPPDDEPIISGGQSIPTHYINQPTLRGKLRLTQLNIFGLGVGLGSNIFSASTLIPLWRAVGLSELISLLETGRFSPSPTGSLGKYFSTTPEGALRYQQMANTLFNEVHTIVQASAPAEILDQAPYLDGGIPTVTIQNESLSGVTFEGVPVGGAGGGGIMLAPDKSDILR